MPDHPQLQGAGAINGRAPHSSYSTRRPNSPAPPTHPSVATVDAAATTGRNDGAVLLDPAFQAFPTIAKYSSLDRADDSFGDVLEELRAITAKVTGGDMQYPEGLAVTQATALNIMFSRLSTLALTNFGHQCFDSVMRLALRRRHNPRAPWRLSLL